MADVVVFHHVHELTSGVLQFADSLRAAGHSAHTPDLFDGSTFESLEDGVAHAESIGFGELIERGVTATADLREPFAVVGFSLGVLPAQRLAQTDARVTTAVLCHSCVPVSEFGDGWPDRVPVQIHAMEQDPFFIGDGDIDAALALIDLAPKAGLFLYPGDQHLFADASLPSHEPTAEARLLERVLALLDD